MQYIKFKCEVNNSAPLAATHMLSLPLLLSPLFLTHTTQTTKQERILLFLLPQLILHSLD